MGLQPEQDRGIGRERHTALQFGVVSMAVPWLPAWPHAFHPPRTLADSLPHRVCRLGLDSRPRLPARVRFRLSSCSVWLCTYEAGLSRSLGSRHPSPGHIGSDEDFNRVGNVATPAGCQQTVDRQEQTQTSATSATTHPRATLSSTTGTSATGTAIIRGADGSTPRWN